MAEFDPYLKWLGIRESTRPVNHYRLLGIDLFESDPDVITIAADRQMSHIRTYQSGPKGDLSQQLLNELSRARRCLLVPEKKARYDEKLSKSIPATQSPAPIVSSAFAAPEIVPTADLPSRSPVREVAPTISLGQPAVSGGVKIKQDPNARLKIKKREKKQLIWTLVGWLSGALAAVGVSAWLIASGILGDISPGPVEPVENDRAPKSIAKADEDLDASHKDDLSSSATPKSADSVSSTNNPNSANTPKAIASRVDKSRKKENSRIPSVVPNDKAPEQLSQVDGIGRITERLLIEAGISSFDKLANSTPEEIGKVIVRPAVGQAELFADFESWIVQAREITRASAPTSLTTIAGIGAKNEAILAANGIDSVKKLSERKAGELVKIFERATPVKIKSITFEQWIVQAKKLSLATDNKSSDFFPSTSPKTSPIAENSTSDPSIRPSDSEGETRPPSSENVPTNPKSVAVSKAEEPSSSAVRNANIEVSRLYPGIMTARSTWLTRKDLRPLVRVAQQLLNDADEFNSDMQFGMLDTARGIGVAVGDAKVAIDAVRQMERSFKIDYWKRAIDTVKAASKHASPSTERTFKNTINDLIDEGTEAEKFGACIDLIKEAKTMAQKAKDSGTRKYYESQEDRVKELKKFADKNTTSFAKLAEDPKDPTANLNHGHYLFLIKDDLSLALPHWAKSNNPSWSAIAKLESDPDNSAPKAIFEIAKSWKAIGSSRKPDALERKCLQRAVDLFEAASRDLTGLDKRVASNEATAIQKKLDE